VGAKWALQVEGKREGRVIERHPPADKRRETKPRGKAKKSERLRRQRFLTRRQWGVGVCVRGMQFIYKYDIVLDKNEGRKNKVA
jgi:hypothetical protein